MTIRKLRSVITSYSIHYTKLYDYLDEVVEARQDTTVVIHPLTDHRRELPLEKIV